MEYTLKTVNGDIAYTVIRKNTKNIRLRVTREANVEVSAPGFTDMRTINKFVQSNVGFIEKQLAKIEYTRFCSYPSLYSDGNMFSYLGNRAMLSVEQSQRNTAKLYRNVLVLRVLEPSNNEICREAFIKWAKRQAKKVFKERLEALLPMFADLKAKEIKISVRDMKTRWGSINVKRNTMSLSVHLLRCESEVIDHIIKHELCHYAHQNHSRAFYAELARYSPNYKAMQKRLKEYGLVGF